MKRTLTKEIYVVVYMNLYKKYVYPVLMLLGILIFQEGYTQTQFNDVSIQQDAVGIGLWYGIGYMTFDAAPEDANNDVKGYTDVFPDSVSGQGLAFGISYGSFGFNYGEDTGKSKINKYADIQQNNVSTDDVYVYEIKRSNRSLTILYQPVRYFYFGVGRDTGTIEIKQRSASNQDEIKKMAYDSDFYSFGFAYGFDPTQNIVAPIVTIYKKIPQKRTAFSGDVTGIGFGVFF